MASWRAGVVISVNLVERGLVERGQGGQTNERGRALPIRRAVAGAPRTALSDPGATRRPGGVSPRDVATGCGPTALRPALCRAACRRTGRRRRPQAAARA